jgi:NADP-dependent 3-hydroxy acid dehydrogenase YdfG
MARSSPFKKILVLGATSGIGLALAEKFAENGSFVIVAGRRKESLDKFVEKFKGQSEAIQFDITDLKNIPQFTKE